MFGNQKTAGEVAGQVGSLKVRGTSFVSSFYLTNTWIAPMIKMCKPGSLMEQLAQNGVS